MFQNTEDGKEIVIENRQLLGIFFLVAVLLGIAFVAGFMVGHGSFDFAKKAAAQGPVPETTGAETRTLGPSGTAGAAPVRDETQEQTASPKPRPDAGAAETAPATKRAPAHRETASPSAAEESGGGSGDGLYQPHTGDRFWQVTAQSRDKAQAVASDLIRSGFTAHVASSPEPRLFRVLVGPLKNQAEAASTRVGLRDKGFNNVIARNY